MRRSVAYPVLLAGVALLLIVLMAAADNQLFGTRLLRDERGLSLVLAAVGLLWTVSLATLAHVLVPRAPRSAPRPPDDGSPRPPDL